MITLEHMEVVMTKYIDHRTLKSAVPINQYKSQYKSEYKSQDKRVWLALPSSSRSHSFYSG